MQPITLLTGPLEVNTYIMLGARAGECFIVDPSDAALVQDTMADHGVKPTHILLTHGHFDHILAVAALQRNSVQRSAFMRKMRRRFTASAQAFPCLQGWRFLRAGQMCSCKAGKRLTPQASR